MRLFGSPKPNIEGLKAKRDIEGLAKALVYERGRGVSAYDEILVHAYAAKALGEIGDARAVEPLIALLKYGRTHTASRAAAEALEEIGDTRAIEPLIDALGDATLGATFDPAKVGVHQSAAEALAKFGDARAVEPLIDVIRGHHPLESAKNSAAEALGKIGFPAVKPLIAALTAEPSVSPSTIEELRKLGDTRAAGTDDDEKVHQIVAKAAKELADVFTERERLAKEEKEAARESAARIASRTTVCAKCGRTKESILSDFERMKKTPGVYFIGGPPLLWCDDCEAAFCGVCQVDLGLDSGCPRCRKELSSVPSSA